jgi:dTDP-D-glucose 4,6-dehydratase
VADHPRHRFVRGDVCDRALVEALLREHRPGAVVERSTIRGPAARAPAPSA